MASSLGTKKLTVCVCVRVCNLSHAFMHVGKDISLIYNICVILQGTIRILLPLVEKEQTRQLYLHGWSGLWIEWKLV